MVAVTADHISGGRVEVGVGAGWFEQEHRQNGFPFPPVGERFDMFGEYVEVLVKSWMAETFDYTGAHFALEGQQALPAPVQSPHPPVILGGRGRKRSLGLAARFAAEYNSAFTSVEDFRELRFRLGEACSAEGRDPASLPMSLMTLLAPGGSESEATSRLDRMATRFRGPLDRCHAGTIDELVEVLRGYSEAGVERIYLQYPDRQDFEGIELFGELARAVAAPR